MQALFQTLSLKTFLGIFVFSIFLNAVGAFGAPVNVSLSARNSRVEGATLKPAALTFPTVAVGERSLQWVAITNTGRSSVSILSVRGGNSSLSVRGLKFPFRIAPQDTATVEVSFLPLRNGRSSTDFTFVASRGAQLSLHAVGTGGAGGLVSRPGKVSFGKVKMGWGQLLPVTLANNSSTPQIISRVSISNSDFSVTGISFPTTLDAGESITFSASFVPRHKGITAGRILATTRAATLAIPVDGEASQSGSLGVTPAQLSFGNVNTGTTSTLSGSLKAGAAPVTVYSATVTSQEFSLKDLRFPITILPNRSLPFNVTFAPAANGAASAVLSFQSSGGSPVQETMAGNGVSKTSHRVTLTWNPDHSAVAGYNVFRASNSAGPFSQINPSLDSTTSFIDSSVQSGFTYYYATTAVSSNGKQSGYSNQVSVAIP
jgi:hypothetical protein